MMTVVCLTNHVLEDYIWVITLLTTIMSFDRSRQNYWRPANDHEPRIPSPTQPLTTQISEITYLISSPVFDVNCHEI
jgi:hypothetical protein